MGKTLKNLGIVFTILHRCPKCVVTVSIMYQSSNKSVAFISSFKFPGQTANTIQFVNFARAFLELRLDVDFYCGAMTYEREEFQKFYGIKKGNLTVKTFGTGYLSFVILGALLAVKRYRFVYTRDVRLALIARLLGKLVFLELHEPYYTLRHKRAITVFRVLGGRFISISEALTNWYKKRDKKFSALLLRDGFWPINDKIEGFRGKETGENTSIILGYIGSLNKGKGAENICRVAAHRVDCQIEIYSAHWFDQFEAYPNIIRKGFVSPSRISEVIKRFDIGLAMYDLESYGNRSAHSITSYFSPLKVFEYVGNGTPALVSDLAVIREFVSEENGVVFVDIEDVNGWITGIDYAIQNYSSILANAISTLPSFTKKFSWESRAEILLRVLEKYDG